MISYEEMRKYFDLPLAEAASKLNVSESYLKKQCRKQGIYRWPYRKISALKRRLGNSADEKIQKQIENIYDNPYLVYRNRRKKSWPYSVKETEPNKCVNKEYCIQNLYDLPNIQIFDLDLIMQILILQEIESITQRNNFG